MTVLTSPLWDIFLRFSGLGSVGLRDVGLGGVRLGGILLTRGGASLSVSLPSLTQLFSFSLSSSGSFELAGRREVGLAF